MTKVLPETKAVLVETFGSGSIPSDFAPKIHDLVRKGVPFKGIRFDLLGTPVNPALIDSLERDSYFSGVDYAQLEFHRLFTTTRVAKNRIAVERSSLYTLESYLSAGVSMFEAVYYHKTVRAAELMLLRILEESASNFMTSPFDDIKEFNRVKPVIRQVSVFNLPDTQNSGSNLAFFMQFPD